jgi:ATP-dependent helicase HrpA
VSRNEVVTMSQFSDCPISINEVLRRPYFRLREQWNRILRLPDGERKKADLLRWQHATAQAREQYAHRNGAKYSIQYDTELPIAAYRDKIIDLLIHRQVIVLCGETGSGKSTQLPKLCLQAGLGKTGWIGHTQPRRLAARSIAHRLADELETKMGDVVGFKVRFNDQTQSTSLIKLMTDGVLLAEIQRDRLLDSYDCIILDEAHERSLNIDLLMAYLQRILPRRPDLRIVITSATIDADQYSNHFQDAIGPAPIVSVEGRGFPVEIRYRGAMGAREANLESPTSSVFQSNASVYDEMDSLPMRFCDAVDELLSEGRGDILAFFPTEREIRDAAKLLRGHLTRREMHNSIEVLPLYARLTEAEQQRVFQPHRMQRIVLATNVAESSITVPGIRYVIDTGTARVSRFAAKSKVQRLPIEPISQASSNQRSGRCGRLGPGIAIRLYDHSDFMSRAPFATPEIRRSDLASTIVHIKSLGIDDIETLPWLDPPRPESVREGMNVLRELSAIDDSERLTEIGRKLARWPVEPRVGRILIEAELNGCLHDALIVAAAMETQDPRVRPPEKASAADEAHFKFRDPNSDFLSYLRIWDFYHKLREQLGRSRLEKACRESFLSLVRLREWADVHRQLLEQCKEMKLGIGKRKVQLPAIENAIESPAERFKQHAAPNRTTAHAQPNQANNVKSLPEGYESLHSALLSGLLSNVAMLEDVGKYKGAHNLEVSIWPGSGLKHSRAKWIVAGELIETTHRYARTIARIEVEWIEQLAHRLIKYSFDEPHFSKKQGSALVMRRGTLYGLLVSPRISVPLAPIDPALARKLLIEHGLAENELVSRAKFWQHNQAFLEQMKSLGDKTRRRDLVVDPYILMDFYRKCIPESVVDRVTLEKWDKTLSNTEKKQNNANSNPSLSSVSPYLSWDAIAVELDRPSIEQQYPEKISVGVSQLPLRYRYEPGDATDGVSVVVPESIVHQLNHERLEWLVPGLLEEKLTCLIKALPKRLRRQLVPVPDTVKKLLPKLIQRQNQQAPFWKSLCEIVSEFIREPVKQSDFDLGNLPEHLRMRVELVDDHGKRINAGRDLVELQQTQVATAVVASPQNANQATKYDWTRSSLETWDIESLPKSVVELRGGVRMNRYPTLIIDKDQIRTELVDHELIAEQLLRRGLVALIGRIERREIRSQIQFLPQWSSCSLWLSDRFAGDRLRDMLSELIARLAFIDMNWTVEQVQPVFRTRVEFEINRLKRIERIGGASAEVGRWLPRLAEANHKVRSLLEKSPNTYAPSLQAIREQLTGLFQDSLSYHTPWCYVREIPRYLLAIAARLERLKTIGTVKDMTMEATVSLYWQDFHAQLARVQPSPTAIQSVPGAGGLKLEPTGKLLEYRWLIEELRVSLYAQQLGTRVSVSPKRLDKMREQIAQGEP